MENQQAMPAEVPARRWLLWAALLMLIYLGVTVRFWNRVLVGAETWALYYAGQPFSEQIASIRGDLVHPPLIYMVERIWLGTFGQTDNAAKAMPVVFILPSILLITLLATRITPHWRLLSFFMASSYYHAAAAIVMVRMYGLAILLTYALLLLWDNWRKDPRNSTLLAWVVVGTILIYTHLFGGLVISALVVANWIFGKRKALFTAAATLPGFAFLPWFFYVLPVYHSRGLAANLTWVHKNMFSSVGSLLFLFFGGIETAGGYSLYFKLVVAFSFLHLGLFLLALYNHKNFWPLRAEIGEPARWFWIGAIFFGVPVTIVMIFSKLVMPALEARFVMGALPGYWIALFLMCDLSGRTGRLLLRWLLVPLIFVAMGSYAWAYRVPNWQHQDVDFVSRHAQPHDLLLGEDPDNANAMYWEWTRRYHRTGRLESLPSDIVGQMMMSILKPKELETIDLTGVNRVWLFCKWEDKPPMVRAYLATKGFEWNQQATAGVDRLYLYERKSPN